MSLKALRTLVTIARHGTFARAADLLSLTPSAVSLHIKTLEDELQVALFDRSRRQVMLTEAGQLAVARAEGILAAYDELADTLASGPSLRGRLRIGAIHTVPGSNVGEPAILEALTSIRRAGAGITVTYWATEVAGWLHEDAS